MGMTDLMKLSISRHIIIHIEKFEMTDSLIYGIYFKANYIFYAQSIS